jgi:hypothetical protein
MPADFLTATLRRTEPLLPDHFTASAHALAETIRKFERDVDQLEKLQRAVAHPEHEHGH